MSQHINQQNFQVIIRVRPLNCKQQEQIQTYEHALSKKFKNSLNSKMIKLSPAAYAFYTKFYNVSTLNDIMKVQNNTIYVIDTEYKNLQKKMKPFVFSNVYNQKQTSEQIFNESINEQIQGIFQGYNYTILAYGITGSGKTHTVFGSQEKNQKGISGLALNYLLRKKKQLEKDNKTKVNLGFSFVQIYNENVRDLLNSQGKMLNIVQDSKGSTSFTDAIQIQIHNQDQIHDLINIGLSKRSSGATLANQYSSRSHAILQMNVEIMCQNSRISSRMFIIDLAGSEKIQTLNCAKKMQEGANINKSLLALGNCINILAQNSKKGTNGSVIHIPYRDSKLTRILKDSLGGNAKTLMISCVSQNPFTIQQTITTLNYAQRAQRIKKQIKKNKVADEQQQHKICIQCMKQMNGDSQFTNGSKIILPPNLTQSSTNNPKDEMLQTFFQQIYEDIIENIKQKFSIQKILSQGKNRTSLEQIQKIKQVNQNQRVQLKETMWKLFSQKQQDYCHKLSELNQFVGSFNQGQERAQRGRVQRKAVLRREQERENENLKSDLWSVPASFSKRESADKVRDVSLSQTRRPLGNRLQNGQNNQQEYFAGQRPHQSIKFLLQSHEKQNTQNNSRFSFASLLLTSENVLRRNGQQGDQNQKSSQKLTKRKKSRSKFQVVKKMSASKFDSKQFVQSSL